MTTTMPVSTPPVNNAKNTPIKGEPRRGKPKGKSGRTLDTPGSTDNTRSRGAKDVRNGGKSGASKDAGRPRDGHRKQSPAIAVPSSVAASGESDDSSKYSGSTFHSSPNASSLPRPPFKSKSGNSPPLNGTPVSNTNNALYAANMPPPPPQMMYRPAPQYGVPYGAFPGYPSGAYPPVMHTPMGMVPPSGVPAYGGHVGASPMGPIAGFPPMVMNAPPQSNFPH